MRVFVYVFSYVKNIIPVKPMVDSGKRWMSNEQLLQTPVALEEFAPTRIMEAIAWCQETHIWNHPSTQEFLREEMAGNTKEFGKFRRWLESKPRWSPFRVEWSVFSEPWQVAGQVDSVWIDLDADREYVIVDWKRSRGKLTNVMHVVKEQAFGRLGHHCCSHLYDTPYTHYSIQQNLYAHILQHMYDFKVSAMFLVQCHPDVNEEDDFNEVAVCRNVPLCDSLVGLLADGGYLKERFAIPEKNFPLALRLLVSVHAMSSPPLICSERYLCAFSESVSNKNENPRTAIKFLCSSEIRLWKCVCASAFVGVLYQFQYQLTALAQVLLKSHECGKRFGRESH